ncbi:MAG: hypothetical protein J7L89_03180 [Bacteroidales bacterium]|nr:hypothetical protein [Bacteroidales bacterium]
MKPRRFFFLAISLLFVSTGQSQTLQETRAFGDQMFQSEAYSEALKAYQRVAFFIRPNTDAELLYRIAESFYRTGDLSHAIEFFDHSYFSYDNDSMRTECLFHKADCYLESKNFGFALLELLNINPLPPGYLEYKRNLMLGVTYYGMGSFNRAGLFFEKAVYRDDSLAKQQIRSIFAQPRKINRPNPTTAMWLSVFLPGSGQAYSGYWGQGINSLLLNGFLVGLAVYLSIRFHPMDAIFTVSPWFQRYYQGGLEKAKDLARKKQTVNRDLLFRQILSIIAASSPDGS